MAIRQTAGRDRLGKFAPQFAHFNDDVLFGQVWSREDELSARDRSMITCAGLMSTGLFPQLKSHMFMAKDNGINRSQMVALITHRAFYAGWPKAWLAFGLAKEVYGEEGHENGSQQGQRTPDGQGDAHPSRAKNQDDAATAAGATPDSGPYPLGESADGPNFSGHVWLHRLTDPDTECSASNVTFAPGCINRWHTHPHGQLLIVTAGQGWEQEEGHQPRMLEPGDVVFCPADVRHWHGASGRSSMAHIAVTPASSGQSPVEWMEFPDPDQVAALG